MQIDGHAPSTCPSSGWHRSSSGSGASSFFPAAAKDRRRTSADGIVTIDALTDYNAASPQAAAFDLADKGLSEIETASFDCVNRKYRSEGGAWRQGQMGEGKITKPYPPKEGWSPVPPYYAGLFAKVCAARAPE